MADPLSFFLDAIHSNNVFTAELCPAAPWSISITDETAWIGIIQHGRCHLQSSRLNRIVALTAGDLFITTNDPLCQLGDNLNLPSQAPPLQRMLSHPNTSQLPLIRFGGGGESAHLLLTGMDINQHQCEHWLTDLPALIHIRASEMAASPHIRHLLNYITQEQRDRRPGYQHLIRQLIHVLFVEVIRQTARSCCLHEANLWSAVMDPQISAVLQIMQSRMREHWTVSSLAGEANMSRSAFAKLFMERVGQSPMRFLLDCRMTQACRLLRETEIGLKGIGTQVGYGSLPAFVNAFKRWANVTPNQYRQNIKPEATISDPCST